jgi:TolA-binding protein
MGLDSKLAQIIAITVMVGALFCFSWLTVWGQSSRLVNPPIVSDKPFTRTDTSRVVDKDEIQRISDDTTLRIQRLENKVSDLEQQIQELRGEIEEIRGG